MRVDDGRQGSGLLAPKMKARTVVGRGRRADPGHELRLGTEKESEKCEDNRWDGQKQEEKHQTSYYCRPTSSREYEVFEASPTS